MSMAALVRRMRELGAPPEAIEVAIEAVEAEQAKLAALVDQRKADQRARVAKHRAAQRKRNVTVTSRSRYGNKHGGQHSPNRLGSNPKNNNPPSPPTGAQTPTGVSAKRGASLPSDWKPKDRHFAKAAEKGLDHPWVLDAAEAMREWAESNRNRPVARKADWDRTFDSWLRREIPRACRGPPTFNGSRPAFDEQGFLALVREREAAKQNRH